MALSLLYFYDALCGWCYAFSPQVKALKASMGTAIEINVISGGMVIGPAAGPMTEDKADYIGQAIPRVEEMTGVRFGEAFRQRLRQPASFYQSSLKPAIALSIVKEKQPESALEFASILQHAQYYKGQSLEDDDVYTEAFAQVNLLPQECMPLMSSVGARAAATQDFKLAQGLGIEGFPALVAYHNEQYYLLSHGYMKADKLQSLIEQLLSQ